MKKLTKKLPLRLMKIIAGISTRLLSCFISNKIMHNFSIIFFLLLLLTSCGREKRYTVESVAHTIIVDETIINTKQKASDVFSEVTIVPLETTDDCLIGQIDKIVVVGDTVFLLDDQSKSILLFDRKGKFLK